jgi:hypothetical protein
MASGNAGHRCVRGEFDGRIADGNCFIRTLTLILPSMRVPSGGQVDFNTVATETTDR